MDAHGKGSSVNGGQVIMSSPDGPCMRCMGFLTGEKLAAEAALYGNAGARPQVVWHNGVLASTGGACRGSRHQLDAALQNTRIPGLMTGMKRRIGVSDRNGDTCLMHIHANI